MNSHPPLVKIAFCIFAISLNIICVSSFAQSSFEKVIGAEGFEKSNAIKVLHDGGFIIAGETESYGLQERDMLLIRTDARGNVIWVKSYGGPERELITDIVQTPDNGFLFTAEKYQPNRQEGEFLIIIKTDATGKVIWKKLFDEGGNETEGFSLQPTPDGNYIITGMTKRMTTLSSAFFTMKKEDNQSLYLLKIDPNGKQLWSRRFDSGLQNVSSTGSSVIITRDDSYLVAGNMEKQGRMDGKIERPAQDVDMEDVRTMLLLKVKPDGKMEWAREYESGNIIAGYDVIERKEGGFVVAGITNTGGENIDIFLMSLTDDGNVGWAKTFGGRDFESLADIALAPDGGVIVLSATESYGKGFSDILLFKTDREGNIQWAKTFGGKNEDYPARLAVVSDGIVVMGNTGSFGARSFDILLIKTDWDGNSSCSSTDVALPHSNFRPLGRQINGARIIEVEQGVTPPRHRRANIDNIIEITRGVRTTEPCK